VELIHVFDKTSISALDYISKDYHKLMELEKKYMEKVKEVSGEILHEMLKEAQNKGSRTTLHLSTFKPCSSPLK